MEPEEVEFCLGCILECATRRGSNIFQLVDTKEKKDHFVASRRRWLEHQGERAALQESWQNEWHDIKCQGILAKAPPCPERTLKSLLPQQSSSSSRDETGQWISVEDRRRRRVAFEGAAKRMLRCLEDSEDLKVGVSELKGQLELSEKAGFSIRQSAQQAMNENGQHIFCHFKAGEKRNEFPVWPDGTRR